MINLKKVALAVLVLGVSGVASAGMYVPPPVDTQDAEPVLHNGFYAGIGLGGLGFTTQNASQGSGYINEVGTGSVSGSSDKGTIGLNSTLLAGYAWHLPKKIFLGAEIFGNLTNAPVSETINAASSTDLGQFATVEATGSAYTSLKMQSAYGIRALPGYQVSPSAVVYAIAGWVSSQAKGNTNASGSISGEVAGLSANPDTLSGSASSSNNYDFYGYQLGLGSMINVTEHVAVRGDLIYSGYGKQTLLSGSNTSDLGGDQYSITADPSTLEADVALVYMFD